LTTGSSKQRLTARAAQRVAACGAMLAAGLALGGCAVGAGIGVRSAPGLALNLGMGPGGPGIGVSTGWGLLGAGVSINQRGQVYGSAGAGAGAGGVGVGMDRSVLFNDPQAPGQTVPVYGPVVGTAPLGSPGNSIAP
jgi:hypothetical protein